MLVTHGVHLLFASLLLATVMADVFYLRSKASLAIQPVALMKRWRVLVALAEMALFLVVIAMGLMMWMPAISAYPPAIFHSKLGLAVVFLVLAKVRVLKERKSDTPAITLTRVMAIILLAIFCLGVVGGLHVVPVIQ